MTAVLRSRSGVVYAEFLIAFFPLFTLFVCTAQLAMIAQAALVVRHAATCATRKAVVVLDDDPAEYDGEPRAELVSGERDALTSLGLRVLALVAGLTASSGEQAPRDAAVQGGARLDAIRASAYLPLASVAPSREHLTSLLRGSPRTHQPTSVADSLGAEAWSRVLGGYALFVRAAAALSFPRAPGSPELRPPGQRFGRNEPVTARVTLLFPCSFPIGRAIVCSGFFSQLGVEGARAELADIRKVRSVTELDARVAAAKARLHAGATSAAQLLRELSQAELPGLALALLLATDERYVVLRGESTLPNQGAPYLYASELDDAAARSEP
jgi:hypothetical protein